MLPYITLFGTLHVPSYTLLVLTGYALGFCVVWSRRNRFVMYAEETAASYVLAGVGALFGGKLFYMLQGLPEFLAQPQHDLGLYFMRAGLVFYGGLAGCLLAMLISAKAFRVPLWNMIDCLLPALPLAQCFGRVGCFLAGCCYGMPSAFGFVMDASAIAPHGERLFPVQLIEAAAMLVLFVALIRTKTPEGRHPAGLLSVYLISYGSVRFVLEFLRYDNVRGFLGALSVSQWISIGAVALGTALWFLPGRPLRDRRVFRSAS